jgi:Ni2+-binding GTPase involved in maturation of urease and hydrogenase
MRPAERRMCIVINGPVSSGKTKLYSVKGIVYD